MASILHFKIEREIKKMAKKQTIFVVAIILSAILVFCVYSHPLPDAYATETNINEKGLTTLKSVVGLDLDEYTVATKEYPSDSSAPPIGIVPQENVGYNLSSESSKLEILCTFTKGNLQMIHVLENEGIPYLTKVWYKNKQY